VPEKAQAVSDIAGLECLFDNDALRAELACQSDHYQPDTQASDLAIFQYTSGTTRELPEAVRHTHAALVTLMLAALYGTGIRPGDRFMCPSSPAWHARAARARRHDRRVRRKVRPRPAAAGPG
jgi:acetyl-CoA synthetase